MLIPRIKTLKTLPNYNLFIEFDDGKIIYYDMNDDIQKLPNYIDLIDIFGLWEQAHLDTSRTSIEWTDYIDLPADYLYNLR